ncbi:uncharacterized protein LOC120156033 [Hibiscus syriacus]|uniref:uncharacterized protein LOC120156033 n=1 Tax=Hibiscus syriacus TaxID=106335 RepID=UPI001922987D|nr:uncharacterized protein LOC120156033 [Hibiscus syriacus]
MAAALPPPVSSLKLTTTTPFSSPRELFLALHKPQTSFTPRATPDSDSAADSPTETGSSSATSSDSDPFESRLSQVRIRYRRGIGKKAERRKSKKSGSVSTSSSSSIYLPPVPLTESISNGLKVDFGFNPYSERINGRIAILGLLALVLVELASGKSVISYHTPAIIFIQIYFVAAVAALFVKYEKEKASVWPPSLSKIQHFCPLLQLNHLLYLYDWPLYAPHNTVEHDDYHYWELIHLSKEPQTKVFENGNSDNQ